MILEIREDLGPFYLTSLFAHSCFLSSVTFFLMVTGSRVGWPMPGLDCLSGQPDEVWCSEAQVGLPQGGCNSQKMHTPTIQVQHVAHRLLYSVLSLNILSWAEEETLALFYKRNHCSTAKIQQPHKNHSKEERKTIKLSSKSLFYPIAKLTFQTDRVKKQPGMPEDHYKACSMNFCPVEVTVKVKPLNNSDHVYQINFSILKVRILLKTVKPNPRTGDV